MVYHRRSWKVLWILLSYGRGRFWHLEEIVARHSEAQTGCPVTYTYSRDQARRLIEAAGFRVTDLRTDHIFPYRIADYVQYRYVREWYFRWMPAPLVPGLRAPVRLASAHLGRSQIIPNPCARSRIRARTDTHPVLSLFSVPKAFTGDAAVIQDNAIASWTRLGGGCDIVLLGDDPGVAEAAARHGVRHEPKSHATRSARRCCPPCSA